MTDTDASTPPVYPAGRSLLAGKTVLVTAAAGTGIGFATAKRCVEEGRARRDHRHPRAPAATSRRRELGALGDRRERHVGRRRAALLRRASIDELGRVDVLVNNAGLGGTATLAEMTDEQWSAVLDVTLTGTMRMTRAALRHMCARGAGVIVNNASVVGWRAQEGQAHYAAAKAGVMALTRCAAIEAARAQRARQRGRAVARDARAPRQGDDRGAARRAHDHARRSAARPSRGKSRT